MWSNLSSEVRMQQPGAKEIAEIIKLEEHSLSMPGGGIDDEEALGPFRLAAESIKTRLVKATRLLDKVDEIMETQLKADKLHVCWTSIAVMCNYDLCYDTPVTDGVLGYLTEDAANEILQQIAALPKR